MTLLSPNADSMGHAIEQYYKKKDKTPITVCSPDFDDDEIPVQYLFRTYSEMPESEKFAIDLCRGKVLDVGSAAGCHTLELQKRNIEVVSIDISQKAIDIQKLQGVINCECVNFFDVNISGFDTILMLMNGTGIIGTLDRVDSFFKKCSELLSDAGQILIDSTDLKYLYENEDGSYSIPLNSSYYGEVEYTMKYKGIESLPFTWLYLDFETLYSFAVNNGFKCEKIFDRSDNSYLARIYYGD